MDQLFFLLVSWLFSVSIPAGHLPSILKTFYPSICNSCWPVCLPSVNSQQVPSALFLPFFLFFNLISAFFAETLPSEASFSLPQLSAGVILLLTHFLPSASAVCWACDSPSNSWPYLCIISECSFCPWSIGVSFGLSLVALIYFISVWRHVLWLFILAVKDPCQFTPAFFCYPLLSISSQCRERSYTPFV